MENGLKRELLKVKDHLAGMIRSIDSMLGGKPAGSLRALAKQAMKAHMMFLELYLNYERRWDND